MKPKKYIQTAGCPPYYLTHSRNIRLFHIDGTSENVDIEKATASNSPVFDPYIREGDEIFIPFEPQSYPTISISGEVRRPVSIPWKEGDKASFLIKLSFGITENGDFNNIVLFNPEKNLKTNIQIDSNLNLIGQDYDLTPGSSIIVGNKIVQTVATGGMVAVKGNVRLPGIYIIKQNETRLREMNLKWLEASPMMLIYHLQKFTGVMKTRTIH